MGILITPDPLAPLGQGDILCAPALYRTAPDGAPVNEGSGSGPEFILVISRNCKALRASHIVVSPIFPQRLSDLRSNTGSYKDAKALITAIRDGGRGQDRDRFYLGSLGQANHRCAAHLDELYTVEIPQSEAERREYIQQNRVHTLDRVFLYDLHARLFMSFARRGFDDVSWYSDQDLQLLLTLVQKDCEAANAALSAAKVDLNIIGGDSGAHANERRKAEKQIESKTAEVAALRAELEPLRAESDRRKQRAESPARTRD